jgi:hypothetical protein
VLRVVRAGVDLQDVLDPPDELAARLRWDAPALRQPGLQPVLPQGPATPPNRRRGAGQRDEARLMLAIELASIRSPGRATAKRRRKPLFRAPLSNARAHPRRLTTADDSAIQVSPLLRRERHTNLACRGDRAA